MNVFSTREIATLIWSIVFLIWIFTIKGIRTDIKNVIKAIFNKRIIVSFIPILIYTGILIIATFKIKIKQYINIKDVIIWSVFVGVPLYYSVVRKELNKKHFTDIIKENIKLIILIEFIISTFTFSIITELFILPIFTILFLLEIVSDTQGKYKDVNKIISYLQVIAGFFILYKSFSIAINQYRYLNHGELLISLITPFIMSILYLPIIFLFGILTKYNNVLFRFKTKLVCEYRALKRKTKNKNSCNYDYKVQDISNISNGIAKRKTISLILKRDYDIKEIENICIEQFCKYNYKNDVVWIYVATNSGNYITKNWVLRAQWINPKLNKNFRPISIGAKTKDNIHYQYNKSYNNLEKYYKENIFKDDKNVFINNIKLYDRINIVYDLTLKHIKTKSYKEIARILIENQKNIEDVYSRYGNIGMSSNIKLENYLQKLQEYIALIYNIKVVALDESRDFKNIEYLINSYNESVENIRTDIDKDRKFWMDKLNIS